RAGTWQADDEDWALRRIAAPGTRREEFRRENRLGTAHEGAHLVRIVGLQRALQCVAQVVLREGLRRVAEILERFAVSEMGHGAVGGRKAGLLHQTAYRRDVALREPCRLQVGETPPAFARWA